MKNTFAECYGKVCPNPSNEKLRNRWDGVEKYCKKKEIDVKKLSTLFFGLPTDQNFLDTFFETFQEVDMTFLKSSTRELSFLAGITLLELLELKKCVIEITLSVSILSIFDHEEILSEVVGNVAEKLRDITTCTRELIQDNKLEVLTVINEDKLNEWTNDTIVGELKSLFTMTLKNFSTINANQVKFAKSLRIYKEDSNILSWLVGEWSNDLDKPLTTGEQGKKIAFILGKELADLIEIVPGPFAAKAFLKKMLKLCETDDSEISLIEMVDILDRAWKEKLFEKYKLIGEGVNTPILLAISVSLATDEQKVWKPFFEKKTTINPEKIQRNVLEWAYQIYLECLLVRWYNGEE